MPNIVRKPMGYVCCGVWVMGYCGPMSYGVEFPTNGLGGWENLWGIRGYGLREVWVGRGLTVSIKQCPNIVKVSFDGM